MQYQDIYNRETAAHFQWEETRVGVYSQPLGVVQRLIDKNSVWGIENGLASVVPEAINVSMRGFHFLMPEGSAGRSIGRASASSMLTMIGIVVLLIPLLRRTWRDHRRLRSHG